MTTRIKSADEVTLEHVEQAKRHMQEASKALWAGVREQRETTIGVFIQDLNVELATTEAGLDSVIEHLRKRVQP